MSKPEKFAGDVSVALVDVCWHWRNFKRGHHLDSPEYKCCEVTIEFFKALDRLHAIVMSASEDIDNALAVAEGIEDLEELAKNRCYAFYTPDSGKHEEHHCKLKAGHEGAHQWSDCRFCREEERY